MLDTITNDNKGSYKQINLATREDKGDREGIPHAHPIP